MNKVLLLVDPDFSDTELILKTLKKYKNDTVFMRDRKIDNKIRSYLISKMFVVVQFSCNGGNPKKRDEQIMKCQPGSIIYFRGSPDGSLEYIQYLAYKYQIPINGKLEYSYTSEENLVEEEVEEIPTIEKNVYDQKMQNTIKAIRKAYFEDKQNKSQTKFFVPNELEPKSSHKILTKSQKKKTFFNSLNS